uniref:ASCH domain-containing protein n=1 Tax=Serratia proteamaculans (strain 568) TaxID=399741 RepID=A8GLP2_SERP5
MTKALSVRQPWAWLIVNGHKPVENRTWRTNYRGPLLIHASKGVLSRDYAAAFNLIRHHCLGIRLPEIDGFECGGIVGAVELTDCVTRHDSLFFGGPHGFVLANATPTDFHPMKGRLSFFEAGLRQHPTVGSVLVDDGDLLYDYQEPVQITCERCGRKTSHPEGWHYCGAAGGV